MSRDTRLEPVSLPAEDRQALIEMIDLYRAEKQQREQPAEASEDPKEA